MKVLIVDYGMGNLQSVANALAFLGQEHIASGDPSALAEADAVILPGVGAFGRAMRNLEERGLIGPLEEHVLRRGLPFLGICLGMQLLAESSTELGFHRGLGWVPGSVVELDRGRDVKVPHAGWNDVRIERRQPLFANLDDGSNFYFDHSFHFQCDPPFLSASCEYGGRLTAAVQRNNVYAVQFHPEKSQTLGLKLLRNFLTIATPC